MEKFLLPKTSVTAESKSALNPESTIDQAALINALGELENLRTQNPEAFQKAMKELGIIPEILPNSTDINHSTAALSALRASVESMRSEQNSNVLNGSIELPGGKQLLSSKGVEEKMKGILITPAPGFSLKTKRPDDSKVFINVCQHEALSEPSLQKKLDDKGEEIEGLNIPTSVGTRRNSTDKSGNVCTVYDIIVNPAVIARAKEDTTGKYRDFLCQLAIQSVAGKHKEDLDTRYKLPKGLSYQGDIESQMIQDRKNMPKIEEVRSTSSATATQVAPTRKVEVVSLPEIDLPHQLLWEKNIFKSFGIDGNYETVEEIIDMSDPASGLSISGDYVEPMKPIEKLNNGTKEVYSAVIIRAILETSAQRDFTPKEINILVSAYKIQLKVPTYKRVSISFPLALGVEAGSVSCHATPLEGCVR